MALISLNPKTIGEMAARLAEPRKQVCCCN